MSNKEFWLKVIGIICSTAITISVIIALAIII